MPTPEIPDEDDLALMLPAQRAEWIAAAVQKAKLEERARSRAILDSPAASGRRELAVHLIGTSLTAQEAIGVLELSKPGARADWFATHFDANGSPRAG